MMLVREGFYWGRQEEPRIPFSWTPPADFCSQWVDLAQEFGCEPTDEIADTWVETAGDPPKKSKEAMVSGWAFDDCSLFIATDGRLTWGGHTSSRSLLGRRCARVWLDHLQVSNYGFIVTLYQRLGLNRPREWSRESV